MLLHWVAPHLLLLLDNQAVQLGALCCEAVEGLAGGGQSCRHHLDNGRQPAGSTSTSMGQVAETSLHVRYKHMLLVAWKMLYGQQGPCRSTTPAAC
jgi:hypothetical protein